MLISIKDFALTGRFGPVTIGMTIDRVIALLGEPDDRQDFGSGTTGICYGWYELFFNTADGTLTAIQNDHCYAQEPGAAEYQNSHFEIDPWLLRFPSPLTISMTQERLRTEGVSFQLAEYFDHNIIRFPTGVYLDFDDVTTEPELMGIRFFPEFE